MGWHGNALQVPNNKLGLFDPNSKSLTLKSVALR